MTECRYEVVSSRRVFEGKVITVHVDHVRMPDGSVAAREIVDHPGAVGVAAIDETDRIVLIRQYRPAVGEWLDELPAGLLDVDGESALLGAQRELFEETGLRAATWDVLLDLHNSPGMTNEAIRIYLARDLTDVPDAERHTAENEELELTVRRVSLADAIAEIRSGALTNSSAVAGVLAADAARRNGWSGLRPVDAPWPARPSR
jgi:8-oxo-dGDP phosphatase